MRGGYREAAASGLRFSDRQIEWIEKTSSVADVRMYLNGEDPGREDVVDSATYAYAAGAVASNVVGSWMVLSGELTGTGILTFLGSVIIGAFGARRYRRRAQQRRRVEITSVVPKFERRILEVDSPDARAATFFDVGGRRRVFPERLETLRVSLGQEEQLRVCIIHLPHRSWVEWAYPL